MDVLVSGSHGLVGSALATALASDGHRMVRLVRGGSTGGDLVAWDPQAATIDAAALEGVDAAVHLAGEGIGERRWSPEQKARILESRTAGTSLLAGALAGLARPPRVLVSASAVGYYGSRGDEVLDERSTPGEGFLSEVCRAWEAAAAPAAEAGIRTVLLRSGVVLSPVGGALRRMLLPFRLGLGGRQGSGRQWMPWISLADEVGAIVHALGSGDLSGPVNAVAPNPVRNSEFARTLGKVLHRPTILRTPLLPLKLRFGAELVDELLMASQRVAPMQLQESGYVFEHPTVEAALRDLLGR
ncbi:MAG: TIGR01777 family oxidoreductase [Acidimicrobiia bacterium]|nr:TIGR01777 family oxidoreductase [Acidimicrobiia bacterium]